MRGQAATGSAQAHRPPPDTILHRSSEGREARYREGPQWPILLEHLPDDFLTNRSPATRSARFTGRKRWPFETPAAEVQASIATLAQVGIGAVRMRPCFPLRSTIPAAVALLDVRETERCNFRAPQSAAEKNSQDSAIAQSLQCPDTWRTE